MLTRLELPSHTVSGVSVGGIYTSLRVPELDAIFDAGIAPRSFVGENHLFLSHSHADHVGALPAMIGVRGLARRAPPRTFLPAEMVDDISRGVNAFNRGQHRKLEIEFVAVRPGDEFALGGDLHVRVFRTFHTVPSVGYHLFRRVKKLRTEYHGLPGREIQRRRAAGEDLFSEEERGELAYATDTLIDVLDHSPELYRTKTLILECTFLDGWKTPHESRAKCHVHLEEILQRSELFENESLVLMHFSQTYLPAQVHSILEKRLPECLIGRVRAFAPKKGDWPG